MGTHWYIVGMVAHWYTVGRGGSLVLWDIAAHWYLVWEWWLISILWGVVARRHIEIDVMVLYHIVRYGGLLVYCGMWLG